MDYLLSEQAMCVAHLKHDGVVADEHSVILVAWHYETCAGHVAPLTRHVTRSFWQNAHQNVVDTALNMFCVLHLNTPTHCNFATLLLDIA